jgi:small-conductance mechanosensitive channel
MDEIFRQHLDASQSNASRVFWLGADAAWVHGVPILVAVLAVWLILRVTRLVGDRLVSHARHAHGDTGEGERRARTIAQILDYLAKVFVAVALGMVLLKESGTDITPFLTGAGILGVVIGLGAQSLLKDVLAGAFILVENQFRVGDVVELAGKSGVVEQVNLRTTVLRAADGALHFVPNGQITVASNLSYRWSRAVVDFPVSMDDDLDALLAALRAAATAMKSDPKWSPDLLEEPQITGPEAIGEGTVTVHVQVKTPPLRQWDVARELRRRLLGAMRSAGVKAPLPQRILHHRNPPP